MLISSVLVLLLCPQDLMGCKINRCLASVVIILSWMELVIILFTSNMRVLHATCSELVDCTGSYLQTDKYGLLFGLDYNLW